MNKNKIILFLISLFALTACSSINEYLPSFLTEGSTPAAIQEAVSSRVNPEKEIYVLSSAQLSKSGSIIAQSRANKQASEALRGKVKVKLKLKLEVILKIWMLFLKVLFLLFFLI